MFGVKTSVYSDVRGARAPVVGHVSWRCRARRIVGHSGGVTAEVAAAAEERMPRTSPSLCESGNRSGGANALGAK